VFQKILAGLLIFVISIIMSAVGSIITCFFFMIAWNFIGPLFKLPHFDFWHSFAAVFLIALVGSFFHSNVTLNKE